MEATKKTSIYSQSDGKRDDVIFREEVYPRLQRLIRLNDWDTSSGGWDDLKEKMKQQDELMEELNEWSKKARCMSGRILRFQMADSHAVYVVTKVWKTKCTLQWIDYCDGWMDDRLGEKGSLDIDYVHSDICWQDQRDESWARAKGGKS